MYRHFGKRVFDLAVSGLLIIVCSWLMVLIVLSYFITFNWPVFFRQPRLGKGERVFHLIKFRTLSDRAGQPFAIGYFLRATSLDELPQLFQVWSGRLALIGPRPLPVEYKHLYSAQQRRRHEVLPGITGWAQINGRHSISWERKLQLDNYYVQHVSLALDFRIFIRTVIILFSFHKDRSLTEEKFTGSN